MKLTKKEAEKCVVKKARNGRGVFAKKHFKVGQMLLQVTGPMVTCNEDDDMDETDRSNTYRFNNHWFISPKGKLAEMLNHSCEPNAKVVKKENKLYIVAAKDIEKGNEILFDYSTIIASDDSWTMQCNCGADNCRKTIKSFTKLPKTLQKRYSTSGIVPQYIVRI